MHAFETAAPGERPPSMDAAARLWRRDARRVQRRVPGNLTMLAGALALLAMQAVVCWISLPGSLAGRVDFKAFYCAGRLLIEGAGSSIYSPAAQQAMQIGSLGLRGQTLPFLYPPFAGLLFAPLALLSYRAAFLVFLGINLVALAGAVRLLAAQVPWLRRAPVLLRYALFAMFLPLAMALMQGQISLLLLFVFVGVGRCFERGMPLRAGMLLALALVKFQLALPVALLFLGWRCWKVCAGFLMGSGVLAVASVLVGGRAGVEAYLGLLTSVTSATWISPVAAKLRYGMFAGDMPNLHGLFFTLLGGWHGSVYLQAAGCAAVAVWAVRQRPPSINVALPAAMLVSYHMQAYDLVLLLLPLTAQFGRLCRTPGEDVRGEIVRRRAMVCLVLPVLLLSAPVAAWLLVKGLLSLLAVPVLLVLLASGDWALRNCPSGAAGLEGSVAGGRGLQHNAGVAHESDLGAAADQALI